MKRCATLILCAGLAGCISSQNDRDVFGRDVAVEAITPGATPATPPPTPGLQQASITSLDRTNWAPLTFLVPVDGTAHNPSYARRVYIAEKTARQRDEFPTALSASEVTSGSEGQQQLEAPANWLASLADVILLIPGMIYQAPWSTRYSPDEAYARYWHPETATTAVTIPPVAPAAPAPAPSQPSTPP